MQTTIVPPFLTDGITPVSAVAANNTAGWQRLFPLTYRGRSISLVQPATTFVTLTVANNAGSTQLSSAGIHSLSSSGANTAVGKNVYVTWSGGAAASGLYNVASVDSTTAITLSLPWVSGTATFSTSSTTVATVTFSSYNLISGQTTVTPNNNAPVLVNLAAHGRVAGDAVQFSNSGGALPTGISASTTYYVSRVISTSQFTITTGPTNGYEVVCTTDGSGTQTMLVTPTVVTWTGHGRAVGDPIRFTTTTSLPTGFSASTTYYVRNVLSANTFTLAATVGGAEITATATGTGTHTALLYYGSAVVTSAGTEATMVSFAVPTDGLTYDGFLQANLLYSCNATASKVLRVAYGGVNLANATIGTTSVSGLMNKVAYLSGSNIITTPTGQLGQGESTSALVSSAVSGTTFGIYGTCNAATDYITLNVYDLKVE